MNSQTKASDQERFCLTCTSLNACLSLNEGEGFQYICIQAQQEDVVRSFVILLNRWLNKIHCTICVQRDAGSDSVYWLSFRFFELDRVTICSILQQEALSAESYGEWIRYLSSQLFAGQSN